MKKRGLLGVLSAFILLGAVLSPLVIETRTAGTQEVIEAQVDGGKGTPSTITRKLDSEKLQRVSLYLEE